MEGLRHNCWLIDIAADVYICNNKFIMAEFQKRFTKIEESTSNEVSPERWRVCLRLGLKYSLEGLFLNLKKVNYLPSSSSNFVSLGHLYNSGISHNNKCENFYKVISKRILAQAKQ